MLADYADDPMWDDDDNTAGEWLDEPGVAVRYRELVRQDEMLHRVRVVRLHSGLRSRFRAAEPYLRNGADRSLRSLAASWLDLMARGRVDANLVRWPSRLLPADVRPPPQRVPMCGSRTTLAPTACRVASGQAVSF